MKDVVESCAERFAQSLHDRYKDVMIGPAEPIVNRVRNQFIMELLFKLPKDTKMINECKTRIHEQIALLHTEKKFRSVVIVADVDPA